MLKIRRPLGRLIFNMGITIPGKTVFLIETAPWSSIRGPYLWVLCQHCMWAGILTLSGWVMDLKVEGSPRKSPMHTQWTPQQWTFYHAMVNPCQGPYEAVSWVLVEAIAPSCLFLALHHRSLSVGAVSAMCVGWFIDLVRPCNGFEGWRQPQEVTNAYIMTPPPGILWRTDRTAGHWCLSGS